MPNHIIFVVGAGLQRSDPEVPSSEVTVDLDAGRVCAAAAQAAEEFPDARIYITAGWAEEYQVKICDVYKKCIMLHGVAEDRIMTDPGPWGTNAEVVHFLNSQHFWWALHAAETEVIVVNRDFHIKRTMLLLSIHVAREFDYWQRRQLTFIERPVPSDEGKMLKMRLREFGARMFYRIKYLWLPALLG